MKIDKRSTLGRFVDAMMPGVVVERVQTRFAAGDPNHVREGLAVASGGVPDTGDNAALATLAFVDAGLTAFGLTLRLLFGFGVAGYRDAHHGG